MSKVKNISGGPLDVPLLSRIVADGEVVEVPDFQPGHNPQAKEGDADYLPIVWPEGRWQPVTDKAAKTAASAKE